MESGVARSRRTDRAATIAHLSAAPPVILDRGGGHPLYRQIEKQLRDAIVDGRLRPGARLPPVRRLAEELEVGRITVITAYEQLAAEGYIAGRVGSGTRVADHLPEEALHASSARARLRLAMRHQNGWGSSPAITERALSMVGRARGGSSVPFDFGIRPPGMDMLPRQTWERLYRRAWTHQLDSDAGQRARPSGDILLRRAIAEYLGVTRGMRCEGEDVVIAPTTQAILCAAAELWLAPDRTAVVEDPSCPGGRQALELQQPTIVSAPVDHEGLVVDALPESATLTVVTPSCHFPTGATMSLQRRHDLLAWGRSSGSLLVELDLDAHYRYAGRSLPALHALDGDERVLYVGDFGHVLFHGVGLAYAVVPPPARDALREILSVAGHAVPRVDQHALALFITEGFVDRHLRRLRLAQLQLRDVMVEAVRSELDRWATVDRPDVGTRATLRLRPGIGSALELAKTAYRDGVRVGLIWSASGEPDPERLSLVFGDQNPANVWRGIRRLRRVFENAA
jgi:GntR family transcriptional regulator / MocR family aminotransferase